MTQPPPPATGLVAIAWPRWPAIFLLGLPAAFLASVAAEIRSPVAALALLPALPVAALGAACLVNTTRIEVRDGILRVQHGPVPWFSVNVPVDSIQGISARARSGRDGVASWEIVATRRDGEPVVLVGVLITRLRHAIVDEQAREIERMLGLRA